MIFYLISYILGSSSLKVNLPLCLVSHRKFLFFCLQRKQFFKTTKVFECMKIYKDRIFAKYVFGKQVYYRFYCFSVTPIRN